MFANVIIDISHEKIDKTFQYRVPDRLREKIRPGVQVKVPFGRGNHLRKAYVLELTEEPEFSLEKMKEIDSIEESAVEIEAHLMALAAWMKRNYGGTMQQALSAVLPVKSKAKRKEKQELLLKADSETARIALSEFENKHYYAKARLLSELIKQKRIPREFVIGKLHVSAPTIRSLEAAGLLITVKRKPEYRNPLPDFSKKGKEDPRPEAPEESQPIPEETRGNPEEIQQNPEETQPTTEKLRLNPEQEAAVSRISEDFENGIRKTYLLHGITGSGKTEVYMELIGRAVEKGGQAIVLIPEIALTYQTVMRFYRRFGDRVSILNSRMSPGERYDQYLRAKEGEIDIMIGPRSALFTPFPRLSLIVVDEEHETSYKSERTPRYHARETAIERAKMVGASVILGSATPSVDSYYRARKGELQLLTLSKRAAADALPSCEIIDLREELRAGNRSILSRRLTEEMERRLSKKEQIMLFLNRRGISGFVSCRACGEVIKCPHCDVSLSLHRGGKLKCHYCGFETRMPEQCPVCASRYIGGMRAGTEKIEEVVKEAFPSARVLRMDADTTRDKDGYEKILTAFSNREADVLVGTQMIVKGHDFPNVTLVGVLAADLSLNAHDFHAAERTFDLLTQAAGRAGRGVRPGEALIQTYRPEHYSIVCAAAQDYEGFYREEIAYRRLLSYPPAAHMLTILCASEREELAEKGAERTARLIRTLFPKALLFGPSDAAIAKINDIYKKVLYIKDGNYDRLVEIKDAVEAELKEDQAYRSVFVQFDFDPENGF